MNKCVFIQPIFCFFRLMTLPAVHPLIHHYTDIPHNQFFDLYNFTSGGNSTVQTAYPRVRIVVRGQLLTGIEQSTPDADGSSAMHSPAPRAFPKGLERMGYSLRGGDPGRGKTARYKKIHTTRDVNALTLSSAKDSPQTKTVSAHSGNVG